MTSKMGKVTSEARVSRSEILVITCRALTKAKPTLMMLRMPKPKSSRTWRRSLPARLMISPALIFR